jgi:uncharacterized membrane protein YfcA
MTYVLCGVIIGVVMGLTGAGGALVAIPLFMQFLGMDLKEASVYSLVAVVIASLMNFFAQRSFTQYRTAVVIVLASAFGSYMTAPYKEILPTIYVALILTSISLYALYSVWKPLKNSNSDSLPPRENIPLSIFVGLILGTLTTFTGLGGGVLMLPLFLAVYRYTQFKAVSTSLFAVGLSSLASLVVQVAGGTSFNIDAGLGFLLLGIFSSAVILNQFVKYLPLPVVTRIRQILFTFVVILAISKIF